MSRGGVYEDKNTRVSDSIDGVFVIDKPSGITSHDAVLFIRRAFNIKKVGHAGTLDPMATGVLVILLGKATKLSGKLVSDDKEYEATMRLGVSTDTHDREGKVVLLRSAAGLDKAGINEAFNLFRGRIEQVPPMVSAKRHKGRKLYELARKGIEVKREPVRVNIYDIRVKTIAGRDIEFYVHCSKGTYIRKLADDIGERLGCGAHLTALRRISSGKFNIRDAVPLDMLRNMTQGRLKELLIWNPGSNDRKYQR